MTVTTQTTQEGTFAALIRERRSVRTFDPEYRISREQLNELLGEAILAPSSTNLQPWRFLVIDSQPLKEQLLPIAYNQKQVTEASAVIAVLGDLESYTFAEKIYSEAVRVGFMPEEVKTRIVEQVAGTYGTLPAEMLAKIVYIDCGLISMQLMLAAKAKGYDTVPMGGYDAEQFKQAFNISDRYLPIMLIAIGKALSPGHPTVRLSVDEVTSWNEFAH